MTTAARFYNFINKFTFNLYKTTILLGSVAILASGGYVLWLYIDSEIKYKLGASYIKELNTLSTMQEKEYYKRIEENFANASHPNYKAIWGLKLLEILNKNNNQVTAETILSSINQIRGVYAPVANAVKIELANLLTSKDQARARKLVSSIGERSPFYPLATEVNLNIMLENGLFNRYETAARKLLPISSTNLFQRISETMYVASKKAEVQSGAQKLEEISF